ncbi:MAG TPA: type II toxin-antitoxin system prevent-host-death family antitoxin [Thermoanaerobaculia bacterium]|jgi:prevent-host-death family protein|nr:type II toxin-antitoxin system prevent-host-death family antitoxin [Thermoanaerobaculia bacterium]
MSRVNIHEAKTHLSRLVDEAVRGGEVIIARGNKPLVKLVPVAEARPPRRLGTAAGKVRMSEDFDEPLPDFDEYQ